MDVARQLTTYCRTEWTKRGVDIVAISSDGEFINLMVRDEHNRPLTLFQLSKDVWSEVSALKRRDIVKELQSLNKNTVVKRGENCKVFLEGVATGVPVTTPKIGWNNQKSSKKVNTNAEHTVEKNCTDEDIVLVQEGAGSIMMSN